MTPFFFSKEHRKRCTVTTQQHGHSTALSYTHAWTLGTQIGLSVWSIYPPYVSRVCVYEDSCVTYDSLPLCASDHRLAVTDVCRFVQLCSHLLGVELMRREMSPALGLKKGGLFMVQPQYCGQHRHTKEAIHDRYAA